MFTCAMSFLQEIDNNNCEDFEGSASAMVCIDIYIQYSNALSSGGK